MDKSGLCEVWLKGRQKWDTRDLYSPTGKARMVEKVDYTDLAIYVNERLYIRELEIVTT
jgi:hypothetical protein